MRKLIVAGVLGLVAALGAVTAQGASATSVATQADGGHTTLCASCW
jgi:hypothetical protein